MTTETFRAAAHDRHSKGRELAAQLLAHQNRDDPEGAFRMALFALMKAVRGRVDCEGVMLNVLVDSEVTENLHKRISLLGAEKWEREMREEEEDEAEERALAAARQAPRAEISTSADQAPK